jgi:hypothetical protein
MGYDPWTAITNCYLNQEVDLLDNPHWHHSEILGHWNDLKVSQTERTELWVIVHEFVSHILYQTSRHPKGLDQL